MCASVRGLHVDSKENMAKSISPQEILSSRIDNIVYLLDVQKSPQFANFGVVKALTSRFSHILSRRPKNTGHFRLVQVCYSG